MTARAKPSGCIGCECWSHGTDYSQVTGTGASGVMIVGEASGQMEAREQRPFVQYAPAGSVLERNLRRMGLSREQFSITNVLRCRPKNNWLDGAPWEYSAIRQCRQYLDAAIAERRPRVIVALGGIALRELTGMAGESRGISHLAGYVLPLANTTRKVQHRCVDCDIKGDQPTPGCLLCGGTGWWDTDEPAATANAIPIIGNWHPSYLRHGKMSHCGNFVRIMQRAMNIAAGKDREWLWNVQPENRSTHGTLDYITRSSVGDARSYYLRLRDNSGATVAYDLETSESTSLDEDAREGFADTRIKLAQFCYESGHAIAMPHEDGFREVVRDILALPNVKCGHNIWLFDDKVLHAATGTVPAGTRHDTLQMFHHWQPDLPAHLQYVAQFVQFPFPWKHLAGTDLAFYGCCDVDATLRLYNFLEHKLKTDDIWGDDIRGYVGQVYHVRPVLARMEERGVPIDDAARLKLGAEFKIASEELAQHLMARYPESAKKLDAYKTFPPELKKLPEAEWGKLFREPDKWKCKCGRDNKMDAAQCGKCGKDQDQGSVKPGKWYRYGQREVDVPALGMDGNPTTERAMRWCYIPEFNPNSTPQVIAYMMAKGHKVPKDKHREDAEGNQKDTTAAKELQRLANRTGDDFYLKVIEYRGLTKMRGTYVDGFVPHADGCVHTTFTFDTGIGQLSSRNPNVHNFPKLKPTQQLADAMRAMIAAKDGYVISEWDYKSCHALTLGFLAESERYMRLARLDIHSFTAGHFLRCWDGNRILHESDEALMERFEWLKSDPERKRVRDDQAKHCIAEGELVLTDKGWIPIQNITLEHRLWDGVEWIAHDGLIDQGIREVMEYDGLTATPDHKVVTEKGNICTLWEASSSLARLDTTGLAGMPFRTCHRDLLEAAARERLHSVEMPMRGMWPSEMDRQEQSHFGKINRMPELCANQVEASGGIGTQIRRNHSSVQQPSAQELCELRSERNQVPVFIPSRIREVGGGESTSSRLRRNNDRPYQQQRQLRAGKPEVSNSSRADIEQAREFVDDFSRGENYGTQLRQSLRPVVAIASVASRHDGRTGYRERNSSCPKGEVKNLEAISCVARLSRVYDIANAGPRYCFTVSGKLVLNCILGIGNGLKAKGLYERYMESFAGPNGFKTAQKFLDILEKELFPEVFDWQRRMQNLAHDQQFLKTEFGHIRRFYEVFRWDGKKGCWGHGDQAEQAISFWLSNIAFGHIREGLKQLHRTGLAEKYGLINNVHDSYIFHFPAHMLDEHVAEVYPILIAPSTVLKHPRICPDGLVIGVEASAGPNWAPQNMKKLKLGVTEASCSTALATH